MQAHEQVVIVTGGAAGIGGGVSRLLASRGTKIVAVDIDRAAGEKLQQDLGDQVLYMDADIASTGTADRVVAEAVSHFGRLTGLVNNAHASRQAPFVDLAQDAWDLSFSTSLTATRNFMLAAYPHLKENHGAVVNFGSGAALVGQPTQAAYAAAKEAIRGLSRVVANEWATDGIRVNVVCPMAMTAGVEAWSVAHPEMYQQSLAKIPLGRFGDPEQDVAPVVAFLLSDDARYVTGQTLMADGGANKVY